MKKRFLILPLLLICSVLFFAACRSGNEQKTPETSADSTIVTDLASDSSSTQPTNDSTSQQGTASNPKAERPVVLIYSFHVTNRCPGCIAIEDATKKTLNTYFSRELKEKRIKLSVLNVDDEANKSISEKYEAFGSGLFVTRVYKGKETTTDMTGEGFKYALNKEEKFIELLKTKITDYLK